MTVDARFALGLEALALAAIVAAGEAINGPMYVEPWWTSFSLVIAAISTAGVVFMWKRKVYALALGLPGIAAITAPLVVYGSVWQDGAKLRVGMSVPQVLETMQDHWLYHWPSEDTGPRATRVADFLGAPEPPPWSSRGQYSLVFTDHPPSADTVHVAFRAEAVVLGVEYGVD